MFIFFLIECYFNFFIDDLSKYSSYSNEVHIQTDCISVMWIRFHHIIERRKYQIFALNQARFT